MRQIVKIMKSIVTKISFKTALYFLAIIDEFGLVLFYLQLSTFSQEELIAGDYIGFNLIVDFCFITFLIIGSLMTFESRNFQKQVGGFLGRLLDRVIPILMLLSIFFLLLKVGP